MYEAANQKMKQKHRNAMENDAHGLFLDFYGALKSKNEIYFQMASVFKEATQGKKN